jgi:hypothetical protein
MVANAAIDLVMPATGRTVAAVTVEPAKATEAASQPASYALASASTSLTDIAPVKVKTIPMLFREEQAEQAQPAPAPRAAAVPLPRPRPASAPALAMTSSTDVTASLSRQPGTMAIAAATRKGAPDDGEVLGAAGIERMRTALALTAEQEEFWPAIASELRALGKTLKTHKGRDAKINVDEDTMQRLYMAAAPLITRLSYEQKQKVKQMAHVMGLHQVAAAL